jgi:hypothetical protein
MKFQIGDLVRFSGVHVLGVVIGVRLAEAFGPGADVMEARVRWFEPDGETFWCIDVTLELISRVKN